jgi:hypothetical protein
MGKRTSPRPVMSLAELGSPRRARADGEADGHARIDGEADWCAHIAPNRLAAEQGRHGHDAR